MSKKSKILLAICAIFIVGLLLYFLPPVHERVTYHVNEWILNLKYKLNPPEEVVFVPQATQVATPTPVAVPTATPAPSLTPEATLPASTPLPSATPAPTSTPLPERVALKGVIYEDQHGRFNYCAPANLSMALSYWGWKGTKDTVGPLIKPDAKDKNVMPYEMVDYVTEQTGLRALLRYGGDLALLKRFIASGFPVLIEKGVYFHDLSGVVSWMGHYQVVTGYDDATQELITQDSFISPDHPVEYARLDESWRAFNYAYILIFAPEKEGEVIALLGDDADETANYQRAAQKASDEIFKTSGIDQYFAWFNRGTSLMLLQDYGGAAAAYDEAFAIYPTIPEADRPWRMLWYSTGPYFAYFHSGRTYDVLSLAETTLATIQGDKNLEESYYWRGMARAALGDTGGAIEDYRLSLKYHAGFGPALYQLTLLGVEP